MADPILADFFRAQVVFQGVTNAPEDVFVNNFVFQNLAGQPTSVEAAADNIADRVHNFFTTQQAAGNAVENFLSSAQIKPQYEVRVYDLGQAPPRMPHIRARELNAMTGTAFPAEVAACLSYYAGRSLPRQRGRIFLGPLGSNTGQVQGGRVHLSGTFRAVLAQAAAGLASPSLSAPVRWCVLSQRDGVARAITGGWVDDAFDTQRRRGQKASVRELWGAPPAS